ncbi:FKBP-type peptidyl-prolyl cis-trans isomerase [Kushneria phyllosphaerae]|uniref:Peptidyl-prolyl cis-trans isomerase n=1 Tax=Kushneria phyllosphaerae TaxID=2100822 RepID=A0A2R8CK23_9GAMM|nr:FKBP-type peptidyl-prolyl cis-trans isomerase [Kushneria phyllosphaerae]SPJ33172.1 FKBP-type 16 kDa peptidyl-prolyl cis-trans isomerase [Kushneria phyllosphaerae]
MKDKSAGQGDSDAALVADDNMTIAIHFTLRLEDGTEVDTTRGKRQAEFVFGDGNLPPGFEKPIRGMRVGETRTSDVAPEHAFGPWNPQNVQMLKRADFEDQEALEEGVVMSFADPTGGGELPGVIKSVDERQVEVDFNHPLAGRTLTFDVEVLDITPATTH